MIAITFHLFYHANASTAQVSRSVNKQYLVAGGASEGVWISMRPATWGVSMLLTSLPTHDQMCPVQIFGIKNSTLAFTGRKKPGIIKFAPRSQPTTGLRHPMTTRDRENGGFEREKGRFVFIS